MTRYLTDFGVHGWIEQVETDPVTTAGWGQLAGTPVALGDNRFAAVTWDYVSGTGGVYTMSIYEVNAAAKVITLVGQTQVGDHAVDTYVPRSNINLAYANGHIVMIRADKNYGDWGDVTTWKVNADGTVTIAEDDFPHFANWSNADDIQICSTSVDGAPRTTKLNTGTTPGPSPDDTYGSAALTTYELEPNAYATLAIDDAGQVTRPEWLVDTDRHRWSHISTLLSNDGARAEIWSAPFGSNDRPKRYYVDLETSILDWTANSNITSGLEFSPLVHPVICHGHPLLDEGWAFVELDETQFEYHAWHRLVRNGDYDVSIAETYLAEPDQATNGSYVPYTNIAQGAIDWTHRVAWLDWSDSNSDNVALLDLDNKAANDADPLSLLVAPGSLSGGYYAVDAIMFWVPGTPGSLVGCITGNLDTSALDFCGFGIIGNTYDPPDIAGVGIPDKPSFDPV